jgi:hypothetical protein
MYKLYKNSFGADNVMRFNDDGSVTSFQTSPDSSDYQAYLKFLEEGGVPEPAEVTE